MGDYAVNRKCGHTFGFPIQTNYSFVILVKIIAKLAGGIYCSNGKAVVKQRKHTRA